MDGQREMRSLRWNKVVFNEVIFDIIPNRTILYHILQEFKAPNKQLVRKYINTVYYRIYYRIA